jgi:hypothetical protein
VALSTVERWTEARRHFVRLVLRGQGEPATAGAGCCPARRGR